MIQNQSGNRGSIVNLLNVVSPFRFKRGQINTSTPHEVVLASEIVIVDDQVQYF